MEDRELTIEDHNIILQAKKRDTLSVMRNVGGGGGHRLMVKNFKIKIVHRKYGDRKDFLSTLPDVPLRIIVSYLNFEDGVAFSSIHPHWAHLQPTVQELEGPELTLIGPSGGHFWPEKYFDVPTLQTPGLKSVSMSWSWCDQGWGNQKGQIWLKLWRDGTEIADNRYHAL